MAGPRNLDGARKGRPAHSKKFEERRRNPPAPYGNGLLITLIAKEQFFEASPLQDAPAIADECDSTQLQLVDWNRLPDLLKWFAAGCTKDNSANLIFNHSLHQHHRSQIHRLADEVGLDSFSQGVGRGRHCSLFAKGMAPVKAVSNDIIQKKARLLYLLAKQQGFLEVSRDECAEMLADESLSPELEQLWETQGKEQLAIVELNQCASRGNLEGLKEAIQKNPELVRSGKCEVASTLTPLNCAAAQGHVPCLEALLEAGAPLEAEDGFGQTALQASRRFEQMDTEAVLIRAGAEARPESIDSMPSQSDLADFIRALPRGKKKTSALSRFSENGEEPQEGLNRAVRSSFEELSQIPQNEQAEELDEAEVAQAVNGVDSLELGRRSGSRRLSDSGKVGSGLLNPATQAILFGKAITGRRHTGELALNSSVNMDMRRDYEGSPDLRGDPKAATRGSRGAAAMALGRRIMESAGHAETRRQQSHRISDRGEAAEVDKGQQQGTAQATPPQPGGRTLQSLWNPSKQPVSLTSARMNGRFGHSKQTSLQRINAWMESAPEEHSSDVNSLTHSVSNPALHAHEAALIARAGSAPENESVLLGNPEFNIRSDRELDLYNEVDALGSRPATEKNLPARSDSE